jgi:integrase
VGSNPTLSATLLFPEIHVCSLNHSFSVTYCSFLHSFVHLGSALFNAECGKKCGEKMARLTASLIRSLKEPGRHSDGDGLLLVIGRTGSQSWVCRIQKDGRRRDIGLGSAKKVSLALARERARRVRSQMEAGIDPIFERRKEAGIPTFREAAAKVFAETNKVWRNAKHRAQWLSTLNTYVFPYIGDTSIAKIDGPAVREVLVKIWLDKPETARRVRQRIVAVIDWSVAQGYRDSTIPMAPINRSLPKAKAKTKHHAALPYPAMPEFMENLRDRETLGRLALEFAILTATRSGEVRGAKWSEIDLAEVVWTIPAERMKAGREHIVPLSEPAIALLSSVRKFGQSGSDLVFPGTKYNSMLSDMTLTKVCRDIGVDAVPHGFRSTFRDWVSEATEFDGEVAEMALAHTISNKVEAAYRRGNLLEKRKRLMNAWADFCRLGNWN